MPVEFHLYPRAYHGFYRVTNARVTKKGEHDTREALRRSGLRRKLVKMPLNRPSFDLSAVSMIDQKADARICPWGH